MQHSKEENAPATDDEDMPELTASEYQFALGVTKGGLNASTAYRQAYSHENMSNEAIWVAASRLRRRPHVARWIAALRSDMAREASYTREQAVHDMLEIAEKARNEGKYIAAINAVQLACKLEGHLGDRAEDKPKSKDQSLLVQVEKMFGVEAAKQAAQRLGLSQETVH